MCSHLCSKPACCECYSELKCGLSWEEGRALGCSFGGAARLIRHFIPHLTHTKQRTTKTSTVREGAEREGPVVRK